MKRFSFSFLIFVVGCGSTAELKNRSVDASTQSATADAQPAAKAEAPASSGTTAAAVTSPVKTEKFTFLLPASAQLNLLAKNASQVDAVHLKITPKDNCKGTSIETILPLQAGYTVELDSSCKYTTQMEVGAVDKNTVAASQVKGVSSTGCSWWFLPPFFHTSVTVGIPVPAIQPTVVDVSSKQPVPEWEPTQSDTPSTVIAGKDGNPIAQTELPPLVIVGKDGNTTTQDPIGKDDIGSQVDQNTTVAQNSQVDPSQNIMAIPATKTDLMSGIKMHAVLFNGQFMLDPVNLILGCNKIIKVQGSLQVSSAPLVEVAPHPAHLFSLHFSID